MYPKTNTLNITITGKVLLGMAALATLGVVIGCMKSAYQASPTHSTTPLSNLKETIDSIPKQSVTLKGTFTQTLEQSVFNDGTTKYHVYDPKGLLAKKAESLGQIGVSQSFKVCIEGRVSEKGQYGHLGKYPYELTVDRLCEA